MRTWLQAKKSSIGNKYRSAEDEALRLEKESTHLNDIVGKVTEKAVFLIKLDPACAAMSQAKIMEKLSLHQKNSSRKSVQLDPTTLEATALANEQISQYKELRQ